MIAWFRRTFLKIALPVTRLVGKVHSPYSIKLIKASEYRQALEILKPGMVFLTHTFGELSSALIPGDFKHGAIYVGDRQIVEATGEGVHKTDLIDFMLSKDVIAIVEPLFCDEEHMANAAMWALTQIGSPYDYDFMSNNKAFYCFELTYAAYQEAMNGESPWLLSDFWGIPTVMGDDFLNARNKWRIVLDTRRPANEFKTAA